MSGRQLGMAREFLWEFERWALAFELPSTVTMDAPLDANRRSLFIDDAAVLLGVSRRTIYYRIRQGRLETVRTMGGSQRVLLDSIERLLRHDRSALMAS
jgi:excisionase family DNA binding protein